MDELPKEIGDADRKGAQDSLIKAPSLRFKHQLYASTCVYRCHLDPTTMQTVLLKIDKLRASTTEEAVFPPAADEA